MRSSSAMARFRFLVVVSLRQVLEVAQDEHRPLLRRKGSFSVGRSSPLSRKPSRASPSYRSRTNSLNCSSRAPDGPMHPSSLEETLEGADGSVDEARDPAAAPAGVAHGRARSTGIHSSASAVLPSAEMRVRRISGPGRLR